MKPFVTQIKLILSVYGSDFLPQELSNLLNIVPTTFWNRGDKIIPQKGLLRKDISIMFRKDSAWKYSTGFIKSLYFENISDPFVMKFIDKVDILKSFIHKNQLELSLNVVIEIADKQTPSIYLNRQIVAFCNKLETEIDFDLYILDN